MDDMEIYEVEKRTAQLLTSLLDIWEGSVRATHHFLSDAEIDRDEPVAFMGTDLDEQGDPYPLLYMKLM